jgi:hypothetical protein
MGRLCREKCRLGTNDLISCALMTHARGLLREAGISCLALLAAMLAGCSGSGSSDDAGPVGGAGGAPATGCVDPGAAPLCTGNPVSPSVTDLSGTWILQTTGAQTVTAPTYANPFHLKSINVMLVQVTQTGTDISLTGNYCDRIQHDDPNNPAKVIVIDAWRLTQLPVARNGTFAPDASGQMTLTMPSLIEVVGAVLTDQACEALPTDPNDPRLFDTDNDGYPGISVGLEGLITGTLRSVQRQATALQGVAVAADRVEGGMAYESDQSVVASDPPYIKSLYTLSVSSADPAVCSSSFVMVKVQVPDAVVASGGQCAWVRDQEATLLGL